MHLLLLSSRASSWASLLYMICVHFRPCAQPRVPRCTTTFALSWARWTFPPPSSSSFRSTTSSWSSTPPLTSSSTAPWGKLSERPSSELFAVRQEGALYERAFEFYTVLARFLKYHTNKGLSFDMRCDLFAFIIMSYQNWVTVHVFTSLMCIRCSIERINLCDVSNYSEISTRAKENYVPNRKWQ